MVCSFNPCVFPEEPLLREDSSKVGTSKIVSPAMLEVQVIPLLEGQKENLSSPHLVLQFHSAWMCSTADKTQNLGHWTVDLKTNAKHDPRTW